jgi:alginate export protein
MSDCTRSWSVLRWLAAAALLLAGNGAALAAQAPAQTGAPQASAAPPPVTQPISPQSPPAAPVGQTGTPPAPRAATPAPLGPSGQITKWFSVRGEFRGRLEGFSGGGYRPDNGDGYMLDRFRFNVTAIASPVAKFVVQLQDARAFDKTTGGTAVPFRNTLDLRMAYGELGGARNMVRAGRQELTFGEQRLIGHLNWVNNARSFDGVRATITRAPFKFDVFATSVVTIRPDAFDKSGYGNRLYGFYGSTTKAIPKATVEPYLFYRQSAGLKLETGGLGNIKQATMGTRVAGKLPRDVDYGLEMAAQTGSVATDDVRAWAGHWVTGKTFTTAPARPRSFVEFNYASGDRNPKDGIRGTFDQLYPTGHDKLGLADQVGWKNVEHLRGGIELKPKPQWALSGSYHSFWLASATDALYAASGAPVARSVAGTAGRFVGQELDAQAVYTYSPQLQIGGGYARVLPGEFLKNTTPGESYQSTYLMVTYVFLGDRPAAPRGQKK